MPLQAFLQMRQPLEPSVALNILHTHSPAYSSMYLEAALQMGVAAPQEYHTQLLLIYLQVPGRPMPDLSFALTQASCGATLAAHEWLLCPARQTDMSCPWIRCPWCPQEILDRSDSASSSGDSDEAAYAPSSSTTGGGAAPGNPPAAAKPAAAAAAAQHTPPSSSRGTPASASPVAGAHVIEELPPLPGIPPGAPGVMEPGMHRLPQRIRRRARAARLAASDGAASDASSLAGGATSGGDVAASRQGAARHPPLPASAHLLATAAQHGGGALSAAPAFGLQALAEGAPMPIPAPGGGAAEGGRPRRRGRRPRRSPSHEAADFTSMLWEGSALHHPGSPLPVFPDRLVPPPPTSSPPHAAEVLSSTAPAGGASSEVLARANLVSTQNTAACKRHAPLTLLGTHTTAGRHSMLQQQPRGAGGRRSTVTSSAAPTPPDSPPTSSDDEPGSRRPRHRPQPSQDAGPVAPGTPPGGGSPARPAKDDDAGKHAVTAHLAAGKPGALLLRAFQGLGGHGAGTGSQQALSSSAPEAAATSEPSSSLAAVMDAYWGEQPPGQPAATRIGKRASATSGAATADKSKLARAGKGGGAGGGGVTTGTDQSDADAAGGARARASPARSAAGGASPPQSGGEAAPGGSASRAGGLTASLRGSPIAGKPAAAAAGGEGAALTPVPAPKVRRRPLYQRLRDLVFSSPYLDPEHVLSKLPPGEQLVHASLHGGKLHGREDQRPAQGELHPLPPWCVCVLTRVCA